MQKIKSLLIVVALVCSFSACTKKQVILKTTYFCEEQEVYSKPTAKIGVMKKDIGVAKAFIKANNYAHKSYKEQVQEHNKACKKLKEKNKKD